MSIIEHLRAPWRVTVDTTDELEIEDSTGDSVGHAVGAENVKKDRPRALALLNAINAFATFAQHDLLKGADFSLDQTQTHVLRIANEPAGGVDRAVVREIAVASTPEWGNLIAAMLHAFESGVR